MADEIEHVRAAWRWAVEQDDYAALWRATDSLFLFYYMRSWFSEGAAMFGSAQASLAARRDEPGVELAWCILLAREAWFVFQLGRQREAQSLLEQSLAAMRPLDAGAELVFPLNYLAVVCSYLGEYGRTDELCHESLAITAALDDRYDRAVACNILGQAAYDQAQFEAARSWSEQSRAIEQELGNRWSLAFSLTNLGKVAYALRDYDAARRMFEESLRIRQELGDSRGAAISLNRLGDIAASQNRSAEAVSLFTQSVTLSRETANPWGIAASLLNLGQLALVQGDDVAAARILEEAWRLARETQALPQSLAVLATFAQLLRRAGEAGSATEIEQIVDAGPADLALFQPQLDRLLAQIEQIHMREASPSLSLEQAIDQLRQHTQASAGTEPSAQAVLRATATAGTRSYPAGLTAREVEVLRLVAQGLTDKQVAEQLIVSPRTVTSHLTSIYGKLDVNTRSAATRFAVEHELV